MLKNYFLIAFRNILKDKFYALINILGLSIGICATLLIVSFAIDEFSYDTFHPKADQTYRIALDRKFPDNQFIYARSPMPMGPTLVRDLPEVENYTRIFADFNGLTFQYEEDLYEERSVIAVDSTFLDFFQIKFLAGDSETALDLPNSLILTEDAAIKYFGNQEVMGKQLTIENVGEMLVSGVVKSLPSNTHFHFDFAFSLNSIPGLYRNTFWGSYNAHNYIRLRETANVVDVESSIAEVIKTYMEPQIQSFLGIDWNQYVEAGNDHNYFLQPIKDIHLKSNFQWELEANGNLSIVYLFMAISFFILLLASINFINLTTARASNRAREVGMRKVLGARKEQLIFQFLAESILICLIATGVALILTILVIPTFNNLANKTFEVSQFLSIEYLGVLTLFSILLGVFSGLYPSFYLSNFQPISILKGKLSSGTRNSILRNGLVIFQFGVSIVLVIGTLVVFEQLNFMNSKSLGFDKEQLLIIERTNQLGQQAETFKNVLLQNPAIKSVSGTNTSPGRQVVGGTFMDVTGNASERYLMPNITGDYDLIETMGFQIIQGRTFDNRIVSDSSSIIVNETAVRTFGWEDPIGKQLQPINGQIFTVIGVIKDFHFESLHQSISPIALFARDLEVQTSNLFLVKIETSQTSSVLEYISSQWDDFVSQNSIEVTFLDDEFGSLYESEQRSGKLFSSFSAIAIIIACLGAFGLAAFLTAQRKKETGVRKVLGASSMGIVGLLSKEFVKLILVANLIAWPLAYLFMQKWLDTFAYATQVNLLIFIIASLASFVIALSTVSFHSIRAAKQNPADTLHQD